MNCSTALLFPVVILLASALFASNANAQKHKMDEAFNPQAKAKYVDEAQPPKQPLTLWYRKPALNWETEALPVGNGRMGAMVFGGVDRERSSSMKKRFGMANTSIGIALKA